MPSPLFSVILPTGGRRPEFLSEAVASVLAQTNADFECIVVDDGDGEPVGLPDDPRFRLIRSGPNRGVAAARNAGLDASRGRYITFLDDDDVLTPDRLDMALEGLRRAPVSICRLRFLDGKQHRGRVLEGDVYDTIIDGLTPHVGRAVVERSRVPRFNEEFARAGGEDTDWWLRLARETPVATVPRTGYLLRRRHSGRISDDTAWMIGVRIRLMQIHADYFAEHGRARAFSWKRIGLLARRLGDYRLARKAFLRSLRSRPDPKTMWHLARSLRPSGIAAGESLVDSI